MRSVYILNELKSGDTARICIHNASTDTGNKIMGTLTQEIGAIDALEFTIYPGNTGYHKITPYATRVDVIDEETGKSTFYGRVLRSFPEFSASGIGKKVVCEGIAGFLHDEPVPLAVVNDTVPNIIKSVLDCYNKNHPYDLWSFDITELDESYHTVTKELTQEGESIYDFITSKVFGTALDNAEWNVRTGEHDTEEYYRYCVLGMYGNAKIHYDAINIDENLIAYSADEDASDLCTQIIPLGAKIYTDEDNLERVDITSVNEGSNILKGNTISDYGCITKTVLFDDVDDPEELLKQGEAYLDQHESPQKTYQITAIDNHLLDPTIPAIVLGDWYEVNAPIIGVNHLLLRITKRTLSIENPANDTFTVGDAYALQSSTASGQAAATTASVQSVANYIYSLERFSAKEIHALHGEFVELEAKTVTTDTLAAKVANISSLTAEDAIIKNIQAQAISAEYLKSAVADIGVLTVDTANARYLTADRADIRYADIDLANVKNGAIGTALIAEGAVGTAQIKDGSITSAKIVELTANKITAGTLSVERLCITGSDQSIVYAINNSGTLVSQNVDTIDGNVLTKRSITADCIVAGAITAKELATSCITTNHLSANAVTAAKIDVADLVASDAFVSNLGANRIIVGLQSDVSVAKTSADSATSAANTAKTNAASALSTANTALSGLKSLYTTNTTTIDGGKITTGSIKAAQIDVSDLFAQKITATGSISGATITTNAGTIAGWTLSSSGLRKTLTSITDTTHTGIFLSPSNGLRLNNINNGGVFVQCAANSRVNTCTLRGNYLDFSNATNDGDKAIMGCYSSSAPSFVLTNANNEIVTEIKGTSANFGGTITTSGNIYTSNGVGIYTQDTAGTYRLLMKYDSSNNLLLGYGAREKKAGATTVYGNVVRLHSVGDASYGSDATNGHFYPTVTGKHRLGSSNYKWQYVYATNGTIQTSDLRHKDQVQPISEKYENLYMKLRPVTYRWRNEEIDDHHDRTRMGFIAQWTKDAMDASGLSDTDLAAYCKDPVYPTIRNADGTVMEDTSGTPIDYSYGLNYGEFIALNTHMVQKLYRKVGELINQNIQLQGRILHLESMQRQL